MKTKIAWGITGAGHFLQESVELIGSLGEAFEVDVFLSRAAVEVTAMYRLNEELNTIAAAIVQESNYSFPVTGKFSTGKYAAIVIAPATSNTVSKCALGIADSLISCIFGQGGKSRVPICVLPTDYAPEIESSAPNGNRVTIYPREVDLVMTERLSAFRDVKVVRNINALREWIINIPDNKKKD